MPTLVCPRCQRMNPAEAVFCYFDGGSLLSHQGGAQRLPHDFLFPSGRRCQTIDEFAIGCQEEWSTARDFLSKDAFRQFFASLGRHDLARISKEAMQVANPDIALTQFLDGLPVQRTKTPKLDYQPRRYFLGRLPAGEIRDLELILLNPGQSTLQGAISISQGGDWLNLAAGPSIRVQAGKEQRVQLRLDTRKLKSAQNYSGQLMIASNGGVAEIPLSFELVARPFAKAPFQGVRTPRELAERMKEFAKQAGPILESGDVERWFATNNWQYPVQGPIAKGLAGVQQFFEAMGLSKPPPLQLSQKEIRFRTHYPDSVRFQVALQAATKKWVYGQVSCDQPWLKPLTPKVIGPQQANILFEADPKLIPAFPPEECLIQVVGNGGQKLSLRVILEVKDAPRPPIPNLWQPVPVLMALFFLIRLLLVPLVDFDLRASVVTEAVQRIGLPAPNEVGDWLQLPWVSILAGSSDTIPSALVGSEVHRTPEEMGRLARDFRHYFLGAFLRILILRTWLFTGAAAVFFLVFQRKEADEQGGWFGRLLPSLIAGTILGLLLSATLACFYLSVEVISHAFWTLTFASGSPSWHILWPLVAALSWGGVGAVLGGFLVVARPIREIAYPPLQAFLARMFRFCRLGGLAKWVGPKTH